MRREARAEETNKSGGRVIRFVTALSDERIARVNIPYVGDGVDSFL